MRVHVLERLLPERVLLKLAIVPPVLSEVPLSNVRGVWFDRGPTTQTTTHTVSGAWHGSRLSRFVTDPQVPHQRKLIAIVDDDRNVCRSLQRLFWSRGFLAQTFYSGEEFLRALHLEEPDCLVLDLHLAGSSGFIVGRRLLDMGKNFPTILITGQDEPELVERALVARLAALLRKPVEASELLGVVDRVLQKRSAGRSGWQGSHV